MNPLALNEPGRTILAMGNDAIVRGGLEAALGYFSTYPGTPASEIGEGYLSLGKEFPHIHAEFSVNEHVAAHGAQGASWAGIRSMVTMKHVGMNVAAEVLHFAGYTGVGAGFVVVIGSIPAPPARPANRTTGGIRSIRTCRSSSPRRSRRPRTSPRALSN